ncbi:hypothetical protein MHYP_G00337040 [Metynnis hypsauchen]
MEDFHISSVELILEVPQAAVRKGLDPEAPAQESACVKARSARSPALFLSCLAINHAVYCSPRQLVSAPLTRQPEELPPVSSGKRRF